MYFFLRSLFVIYSKFLTFRNSPLLRRVLGVLQRNFHADRTESNNTTQQVSLDDSENGYWLLEENSNSDSNLDDANPNTNSNSRRWTSRWIPLDTSTRNSEYVNDLTDEQIQSRSLAEDADQNVNDRHRDQRNQLSPVSANSARYEQPPLFPFRSLRENQFQRAGQNQTCNTDNSDPNSTLFQSQVSDSHVTNTNTLTENVDEAIAMRIANNANRQNESMSDDRQQQQQNQDRQRNTDDTNFDSSDTDTIILDAGNVDPRESSLGVRQGIQLLNRHIDNMQRLCR